MHSLQTLLLKRIDLEEKIINTFKVYLERVKHVYQSSDPERIKQIDKIDVETKKLKKFVKAIGNIPDLKLELYLK